MDFKKPDACSFLIVADSELFGHFNIVGETTQRVKRAVQLAGLCRPNSTFKRGCNTCLCNAEGSVATCTPKNCEAVRTTTGETAQRVKRAVQLAGLCRPNSTFKRGCNTCLCNAEGSGSTCTPKNCEAVRTTTGETAQRVKRTVQLAGLCRPNSTFKRSCNTCLCNAFGSAATCTRINCEVVGKTAGDTTSIRCAPNSTFMYGCNICYCGGNGTVVGCTQADCYRRGRPK
ncbi:pacifastin-like protease inhibitor cvp4 [Schistocerca americana]|uniref:pacifastin-like protease inhibitor cvp4 n=1 Tax=Schistocerca americana TaxID=7009 RepID=UPI001F4F9138|nr:pacifastin-like protease inhibitor cvp4 [Schistocerca americana]